VHYADDYGEAYDTTVNVPIRVYTAGEMRAISPENGGNTALIIGALVIVLIIVFRKRIKRIISR
jgi:hypothetical protein